MAASPLAAALAALALAAAPAAPENMSPAPGPWEPVAIDISPETATGPLPATAGTTRSAAPAGGAAPGPAGGPAVQPGGAPPPTGGAPSPTHGAAGPGAPVGPNTRTPTAAAPGLATPGMPGPASAPVPSDRPSEVVPPASPPVAVAAGVEGPAPAPGGRLCHGSGACRRLLILGGVAGGLGLGSLVTGVALLARPLVADPEDPTSLVTYRPAGAAFLAVGAGLAATWLLTLLAARKAGRLAQRLRAAAPVP
ncbi:hypothetical protein SAMN02745121_04543 [Nannocystis exedens]|uniref:Meckel syndrome type 1 protein n=1 Tax=Nannocystis exedens TaxID=54 RepID=A0A1I2BA13_9BACT|nr:hypothetical protein [Nannocystis exedens]PCC68112.1 hypothetical protein NAEX_01121 [Nannocystis exedens]SFE52738.1 hypothetical protein SAMN02745121_04543 [Nannocystis exedens]